MYEGLLQKQLSFNYYVAIVIRLKVAEQGFEWIQNGGWSEINFVFQHGGSSLLSKGRVTFW